LQVLQMLGEPDRKTRGKCCGVPRTVEVEVWLYDVERKDEFSEGIENQHFQIYFTEDGKVDETRIKLWDEKYPDYVPRIG
jgi:hypothetical protein